MTTPHILVPIDFSPDSERALEYAIELAKALQARLTLLHIIDTISWGVAPAEAMIPPSVWRELETGITERMETFHQQVLEAELQGETLIIHGTPSDTITDIATNRAIDLIVMGTHGRTGLTHALVGSVAERVIRLAPCPVLVTRGDTEFSSDQSASQGSREHDARL